MVLFDWSKIRTSNEKEMVKIGERVSY